LRSRDCRFDGAGDPAAAVAVRPRYGQTTAAMILLAPALLVAGGQATDIDGSTR
jgi:hypothetical protein